MFIVVRLAMRVPCPPGLFHGRIDDLSARAPGRGMVDHAGHRR